MIAAPGHLMREWETSMQRTECIVLAAGKGTRMGREVPKQFLRLAGKPLLIHTLEVFEQLDEISAVWVAYHPGFENEYLKLFKQYRLEKPQLVEGGETRQWSVANALRRVTSKRVLIHEAVRPFITPEFVRQVLSGDAPAVVPTIPIPFTVSVGEKVMTAELDRSKLHNIQLPQAFDVEILREAHERFYEGGRATEDSLMVFRLGHEVRFVSGLEHNIKITTPLDLEFAELIYHAG